MPSPPPAASTSSCWASAATATSRSTSPDRRSARGPAKTLTSETVSDNGRFFGPGDDIPRHVLTQGVGTILDARHLVLIAAGAGKAATLARVVEGPVTAMVPGSALQLHPHVTVVRTPRPPRG